MGWTCNWQMYFVVISYPFDVAHTQPYFAFTVNRLISVIHQISRLVKCYTQLMWFMTWQSTRLIIVMYGSLVEICANTILNHLMFFNSLVDHFQMFCFVLC